MEFDYVIVGGGSAGCVLAARLSEDPAVRVLLIEAGGADRSLWVHVPLAWTLILRHGLFDWGLKSEPDSLVDGRAIAIPRGRILGGCSSTNAMVYVRGNPADYDRWERNGATGWGFADVQPYFKRLERWEGPPSEARGRDGPMVVRECGYQDPLTDALIGAAESCGLPRTADYNGGQQIGVGLMQQTITRGRRCSAAVAYLHPARGRPNLTVALNTLATRIRFRGLRAEAVECAQHGGPHVYRAAREVIVSAGAFKSPQLLMLSGIGPADALRTLGVQPIHDLPAVGQNLQDHVAASVDYVRRDPGPFMRELRFDRAALNVARALVPGSGPFSDLPSAGMAFARLRGASAAPDIQLMFRAAPFATRPWFPGLRSPVPNGFGCGIVLLHPESRGRALLASADPAAPVRIVANFLAAAEDRRRLHDGIKLAREIIAQPGLASYRGEEVLPGASVQSDEAIEAFMRRTSTTYHHACGTCRMGTGPDAVVDPLLRVHGLEALRVVDASVMPDLTSGNINAAVLMIAERAADLIHA
jgi:4-pyridoxate dehydrogenase